MNEINTKILHDKFPNLYKTGRGFECGDGWFDLIHKCSEKIEAELLKIPPEDREHFFAQQVKEKFGTLRFYTALYNDQISSIVDEVERASETTCEGCGANGRLRVNRGWMSTQCDDCVMLYMASDIYHMVIGNSKQPMPASKEQVAKDIVTIISRNCMVIPQEFTNGEEEDGDTIP